MSRPLPRIRRRGGQAGLSTTLPAPHRGRQIVRPGSSGSDREPHLLRVATKPTPASPPAPYLVVTDGDRRATTIYPSPPPSPPPRPPTSPQEIQLRLRLLPASLPRRRDPGRPRPPGNQSLALVRPVISPPETGRQGSGAGVERSGGPSFSSPWGRWGLGRRRTSCWARSCRSPCTGSTRASTSRWTGWGVSTGTGCTPGRRLLPRTSSPRPPSSGASSFSRPSRSPSRSPSSR